MIITDRIKKFDDFVGLDSEKIKYSQELYALAVLKWCYPTEFNVLIHKDAPDFQTEDNSVGIEVTIGNHDKEMLSSSEFSRFSKADSQDDKAEARRRIEKAGGKLTEIIPRVSILNAPVYNEEYRKMVMADRLAQKNKKALRYREKFDSIGLLLLVDLMPKDTINIWNHLVEKELEREPSEGFDDYFLLSKEGLFRRNRMLLQMDENHISLETRKNLKKIANMTVRKIIQMDDPEWQ